MNPTYLRIASCALVALIALALAWELWLAPLRPGGSWLVLKALPLALLVPGVLRGTNYALQCSILLIWVYVAEGLVRAASDNGLSAALGAVETVLAITYFLAATAILRPQKQLARQKEKTG